MLLSYIDGSNAVVVLSGIERVKVLTIGVNSSKLELLPVSALSSVTTRYAHCSPLSMSAEETELAYNELAVILVSSITDCVNEAVLSRELFDTIKEKLISNQASLDREEFNLEIDYEELKRELGEVSKRAQPERDVANLKLRALKDVQSLSK